MARTPLLGWLERIARNHRIAAARNVSLGTVADWRAEAQERRAAGGLSRRDLLRGAGMAAATLALPRPAWAARSKPRIAIVGAGIAGLSCALKLGDKGFASTVYEASLRIGGRMHSNNGGYWSQNQISEWCGELIDTGHTTIQALARRFKLDLADLHEAEPAGSETTLYFDHQFYPYAQAEADFAPIRAVLDQQTTDAGYPTTYNTSNAAGRALDDLSLYDWIETFVPGGHSSPMGQFLDVAYTEELAIDTRLQSSLNLVYLLGFQDTPTSFDIFGVSDERFHIVGGNQRLPEAIAAHLGTDAVLLGYRLVSIKQKADGSYALGFDVGATHQVVDVDYVVLTLPFSVLRTIDYSKAGFDALKIKDINELGAGKSGKLQLQFTSRLWNQQGSNGDSYSDEGYQNTWDVTRAQAGKPGILVDYTGGPVSAAMHTNTAYALMGAPGVQADAERFLARIAPVFPGLPLLWNGKVASSLPHLDPNLLLSYSNWRLGQYQTIAGYEGVRQGNCLFAGEHCSVDFQGFMEGGASTGQQAAHDLIADLR